MADDSAMGADVAPQFCENSCRNRIVRKLVVALGWKWLREAELRRSREAVEGIIIEFGAAHAVMVR